MDVSGESVFRRLDISEAFYSVNPTNVVSQATLRVNCILISFRTEDFHVLIWLLFRSPSEITYYIRLE